MLITVRPCWQRARSPVPWSDVVSFLPCLWILVTGIGVLEAKGLAGLADRDDVDIRSNPAVRVGTRPRRRWWGWFGRVEWTRATRVCPPRYLTTAGVARYRHRAFSAAIDRWRLTGSRAEVTSRRCPPGPGGAWQALVVPGQALCRRRWPGPDQAPVPARWRCLTRRLRWRRSGGAGGSPNGPRRGRFRRGRRGNHRHGLG